MYWINESPFTIIHQNPNRPVFSANFKEVERNFIQVLKFFGYKIENFLKKFLKFLELERCGKSDVFQNMLIILKIFNPGPIIHGQNPYFIT